MIGREWKRREAWSGPALIRRGLDFLRNLGEPKVSLESFTQNAEHSTFHKMFVISLLEGFEGAGPRRKSGGDSWVVPPVPIPNTAVKHPYAESTWPATAREARALPVSLHLFLDSSVGRAIGC